MEVGDIRFYRERWKAVEEIERQELRAMTLEEHWRKLNAIVRFAIETGMQHDDGGPWRRAGVLHFTCNGRQAQTGPAKAQQ